MPRIVADLWRRGPSIWRLWKASRPWRAAKVHGCQRTRGVQPGVLVAGTNCVATDAVCDGGDGLRSHGGPRHARHSRSATARCGWRRNWASARAI